MKIDLSDLSELCKGDTVFSISEGHIRVTHIIDSIIHTSGSECYYINGKSFKEDMHPTCFHSIEECIEYFQHVKKQMDEESKPKKRYWRWDIRISNGAIKKTSFYYDDDGYNSSDNPNPFYDDFEKLKIKKHESEFIDV